VISIGVTFELDIVSAANVEGLLPGWFLWSYGPATKPGW